MRSVISLLRAPASPRLSGAYPAGMPVVARTPWASPTDCRPAGSVSRKASASPLVMTFSAYSGEPGTSTTEAVWTAVIASCLLPRWASPKFVSAVLIVYRTGRSWNATRKRVPGSRYFSGGRRGDRYT